MTITQLRAVACPRCHAPAGEPCDAVGHFDGRPRHHHERLLEAGSALANGAANTPDHTTAERN